MEEVFTEHPDWWRPKEFSKAKHIGLNQVYEGIRSKEIPSIRIGSSYFIPKEAWGRMLSEAGNAP